MPILSGKIENSVKYWPSGQNRAGRNEGGVNEHMLLFMKPRIDHFPLTMRRAHSMWCDKCWNNNTLYLWSGRLWGVRIVLQTWSHSCCLRSCIQLRTGSLFQMMQTISFRCTLRIIHSPVTGSKIYKSPRNGSRIATAGKEVGGNGNFLNYNLWALQILGSCSSYTSLKKGGELSCSHTL